MSEVEETAEREQYKELIDKFLSATEDDILGWFVELPGAILGKEAEFVYIPGRRDPGNRVLVVAHCDTVWNEPPKWESLHWNGAILQSVWYGKNGIGADDRVGCVVAWGVAQAGDHSVLITTGEEIGCIGAQAALAEIAPQLKQHAFMLQVDRAGDEELVFYPGGHCKEWADWLRNNSFAGWDQGWGTFTDITVLAPELGLCAANLAAGYINEHTTRETFYLDAWLRTLDRLGRVLKMNELPTFKPDKGYASRWWDRPAMGASYECKAPYVKGVCKLDNDDDSPWWETGNWDSNDFCDECGNAIVLEASVAEGLCVKCRWKQKSGEEEKWPEEEAAAKEHEHMLGD